VLIRDGIFDALKWSALGAFVLAIILALVFVPKNIDRNSRRVAAMRRRALGVVGVIVALAIAGFVMLELGAPVVIVKTSSGSVDKTRGVLFGARTYTFQDGHVETITASKGTTIVNDGHTPMRVQTQSYGDRPTAFVVQLAGRLDVPPMTITASEHRVDFVGPDHPPPNSIEGVHSEERYWLTW
jgi:hypothetical protein